MKRNVLADRLKGYACLLVLFGHVIMGIRKAGIPMPSAFFDLETFIWSFHVALFLFLSGFVYRITDEWRSKKTRKNFLLHKLADLGIPYVLFSVIYISINSFVAQSNTNFALTDILWIWKTPAAQYWFLYALFFLFCIWVILSGSLKNWQITVLLTAIGYLAPAFDMQLGSFEIVAFSALAFGLGTCMRSLHVDSWKPTYKLLLICIHILLGYVWLRLDLFDTPLCDEFIMVIGIFSSIALISLLTQSKVIAKFLDFINKYSFPMYLLHTICTAGVRILLLRMQITQWWLHILIGCLAGMAFPILAAIISEKTILLNLCFYPSRTWKRLKK